MSHLQQRVRVDRVLGRSSTPTSLKSSQSVSSSESRSLVAYTAGCLVVLKSLGEKASNNEIYLSLPRTVASYPDRGHGTPTQVAGRDSPTSSNILKFEEFAEPSKGKEKTKPLVSVALSPDGRWLSGGEQGQAPRFGLWDLQAEDFQTGPVHIVNVHSYGVRHLVFSPGSHFLASIGYLHDGTIHVWDLRNGLRKAATNRVTSNVKCVVWVGNKLLTVGTRHVRVWSWKIVSAHAKGRRSSIDSAKESAAVLDGRNVVLAAHVHSDFISACALDGHRALVATTQAVCFLDVDEKQPLRELFQVDFLISTLARDKTRILVGDTIGRIHVYAFDECSSLLVRTEASSSSAAHIPRLIQVDARQEGAHPIAALLLCDSGHMVSATADGGLLIGERQVRRGTSRYLPGGTATLGVWQLEQDSNLLVCQENGTIRELHECDGQVKSLRLRPEPMTAMIFLDETTIAYGNARGEVVCRSLDNDNHEPRHGPFRVAAHVGEVCSVHADASGGQIVTTGRDRMMQLFDLNLSATTGDDDPRAPGLVLKQTFDDHSSSVTGVVFLGDKYLLSSSADRTIVLRTRTTTDRGEQIYVTLRIMDLRSMVTAMTKISDSTSTLVLVSCLDKSLLTLDVVTGELRELCRTEECYDVLAIHPASYSTSTSTIMSHACLCVSSADKSIVLRSWDTGAALSNKCYGHIDRITSAVWSRDRDDLVLTTSADGLVISWWFQQAEGVDAAGGGLQGSSPQTPVRKIRPRLESLRLVAAGVSPGAGAAGLGAAGATTPGSVLARRNSTKHGSGRGPGEIRRSASVPRLGGGVNNNNNNNTSHSSTPHGHGQGQGLIATTRATSPLKSSATTLSPTCSTDKNPRGNDDADGGDGDGNGNGEDASRSPSPSKRPPSAATGAGTGTGTGTRTGTRQRAKDALVLLASLRDKRHELDGFQLDALRRAAAWLTEEK